MNDKFRQDSEYSFLALSGGDGEWYQIGKMDHITKSLQEKTKGTVSGWISVCWVYCIVLHGIPVVVYAWLDCASMSMQCSMHNFIRMA